LTDPKKPLSYELKGFIYPGAGLFFREVSLQVLSLLTVFTFVFGMGTGVFRPHQHQELFSVYSSCFMSEEPYTLKTAIENVVLKPLPVLAHRQ
jgi:hypothetical protein